MPQHTAETITRTWFFIFLFLLVFGGIVVNGAWPRQAESGAAFKATGDNYYLEPASNFL
jgi:hypothetical protein